MDAMVRVPALRMRFRPFEGPRVGMVECRLSGWRAVRRMAENIDIKLQRLRQWRQGGTPGPYEIILYPTNRCNLKCDICWERIYEVETDNAIYDKTRELSNERLLALVDEAAELGVQWWSFIGGGEPMIRGPLVMDMCERIRARGMNGVVHTNGTAFKKGQLETLVDIGWSDLTISLDGPNPEINDPIRFKQCFERATATIRRLNDLKGNDPHAAPRVAINMTITNTNYDQLAAMAELATELRCHRIGYSQLIAPDEHTARWAMSPEQEATLPEHMRHAKARAEALGVEHNIDSLAPAAGAGKRCLSGNAWTDAACYEVWLTATIVAEGIVGPCCVFHDEQAQNLKELSLRDVWLGPYFQGIRNQISTEDLMAYCPMCPSNIVARSADLRNHVARTDASLPSQVRYLADRFSANVRRQGVRKTLKRTGSWISSRIR